LLLKYVVALAEEGVARQLNRRWLCEEGNQLRSVTGSSSNSALVFMSAVTSTGTPNVR